MASIPSDKLIKALQEATRKEEKKKLKQQKKQGKTFVNTGAGVIPEQVWQELKK